MNYRVIVQPEALTEMEEAYLWIAEASLARANTWLDGLGKAIASLQTHPTRCPLAREMGAFDEEVRQLLYGKRSGVYRIVFIVRGGNVHVISVRHSARRPLRPG